MILKREKTQKVKLRDSRNNKPLIVRKHFDANIVILKLFPGINQEVVKSILEIPDLKGVILETYGAGNAPTAKWFTDLIHKAINKGIYIVNVSQCISGSVILGHYETSNHLKALGIINGKDITTESAVAKLKYLLGEKIPNNKFKMVFESSLRGEMS